MELIDRARAYGVGTEFYDARGELRHVDPQTLEAILQTMTPPLVHRLAGGAVVMRSGAECHPPWLPGAAMPIDFAVYRDAPDGLHETARANAGHWPFSTQQLASGVYRLKLVDARGERDEVPLIVAPTRAFGGDFDRVWVVAVQLYGLRSDTNWGIGDFGDLRALLRWAAKAGAAGIGLNPLHALFDDQPADCSPYSPSSRLFLNPLYIDVASAPGFSGDLIPDLERRCAVLRQPDLIDYRGVAELKWTALRAAFARFMAAGATAEREEFETFRGEGAGQLGRYACFEVLRRRFATPWWDWPQEWRQPDEDRLRRLRNGADADAIAYVEFLQWVADRQLRGCKELSSELGMPLGLYLDVAVGVKPDGFDAWNCQIAITRNLSVGAPPDLLNTVGQDWGLAGFSPAGLEATLFQPFRDMLAAVMRHAGAIRIDHVLGLQRLYLVPLGSPPRDGAYVRMPLEALLAIAAAESQAHRCVVIGEDLGTVPEGFRERLAEHGIWCYRLMLFERDGGGSFLAAEHYATDALVTFSTHDLPTFAGWRSGHDLRVKRQLGIDPGETDEERARSLRAFDEAAAGEGGGFERAVGFLARTPSRLLTLALEDILALEDQPNIPGTIDQHPNWRRKMPLAVEVFETELDLEPLQRVLQERSLPGRNRNRT
jgi:4-alpha-glucanotransferase